MRISDWSSDVCSSDLPYSQTRIKDKAPRKSGAKRRRVLRDRVKPNALPPAATPGRLLELGCASGNFLHRMARAGWEVEGIEPSAHAAHQAMEAGYKVRNVSLEAAGDPQLPFDLIVRSEEHTSELQSLMRIS